MLGEVIEMAAGLAASDEATVDAALARYADPAPAESRVRGLWVSVAFLFGRHARLSETLPD